MPQGIEPRDTNVQIFVTGTPEGHITLGAQCFGVDISTLHRITVKQSKKLRADLERQEEIAESLIQQASDK
jgi:hypothetical protein